MSPRAGLFLKIAGSATAAGLVVALFLLGLPDGLRPGKDAPAPGPGPDRPSRIETIAIVDRQIDSVLARYAVAGIPVKKRTYEVAGEEFTRTERLVSIPDTVAPVTVNAALNDMARLHGGRAVATENLRLRTVTIHVEIDGSVVHTVILKKIRRKPPPDGRQTRPAT